MSKVVSFRKTPNRTTLKCLIQENCSLNTPVLKHTYTSTTISQKPFKSWNCTEVTLTVTRLPPGACWALSREPTLAWALSLKSNFTVSMRTLPPPGEKKWKCKKCTGAETLVYVEGKVKLVGGLLWTNPLVCWNRFHWQSECVMLWSTRWIQGHTVDRQRGTRRWCCKT